MAAEIIIASIHAALGAVHVWLAEQDRQKALREGQRTYPAINTDPRLKAEARYLESIVPAPVLDTIQERVKRCWDHYQEVLASDEYLPQEVNNATDQLKNCICRELKRIKDLGGDVPVGTQREWWRLYCEPRGAK
jgi:hypothetical protein